MPNFILISYSINYYHVIYLRQWSNKLWRFSPLAADCNGKPSRRPPWSLVVFVYRVVRRGGGGGGWSAWSVHAGFRLVDTHLFCYFSDFMRNTIYRK